MMLAPLPAATRSRAAYIEELDATLAQTSRIHALPQLPWALLALNATFYLDRYTTRTVYQTALAAALQLATAERQDWYALPNTRATDHSERLAAAGMSRATLYRWIFDHAAASGNPAQFLLAQHACEIAEVVAAPQLLPALRLGLISVPASALAAEGASFPGIAPGAASIERLSHALLRRRIPARRFAAHLLLLHATRRAQELTGHVYSLPFEAFDPQPSAAHSLASVPKRLRIAQPPELVQRALAGADPLAITMVEAGLVEAEALRGAPHLLLLAALDRALADLA